MDMKYAMLNRTIPRSCQGDGSLSGMLHEYGDPASARPSEPDGPAVRYQRFVIVLFCFVGSCSYRPYQSTTLAEILKFTTFLIKLLPYRFLLHSAIHQPVSRLIRSSMSEADLNNQGYLYGAAAASPKLRTRVGTQTDGDEEEEDEEEGLRRLAVRLLVEVCERMKAQ